MKLATLRNGDRDGQLLIVSRDLKKAIQAKSAPTMQLALDNWNTVAPRLEEEYKDLNNGNTNAAFDFDEAACTSPLPRAVQWLDASAYVNHVQLVRQARGAEIPETFWTDPLMYQGGSDTFLAPHETIKMETTDWGIDMEAETAVILDDVEMGSKETLALSRVRLIMLVNDVSLRGLIPAELAKGFGFLQSKPSSSFSPVAVTPDELGSAWEDGKVKLPIHVDLNGKPLGRANAGVDMTFNFAKLISHAAKTRPLCAGTILGSGTISNKGKDGGPGKPIQEGGLGYSCLAEERMVETILTGKPTTPFMQFGDNVTIAMYDNDGKSIFGSINQTVEKYNPPA
ncbi:fumarylacetoacetate hydrolase family protein [Crocinitomix catalasitica]|uniref:fumarylacetoacetate hydrolase family protein n=1 Tax=Crocinitomix catalasitica TaxID=184607 RepID=UPI000488E7C2|nr:fumarylacetoacetate hydrolase family protein [Crocinitomix catalasitica]